MSKLESASIWVFHNQKNQCSKIDCKEDYNKINYDKGYNEDTCRQQKKLANDYIKRENKMYSEHRTTKTQIRVKRQSNGTVNDIQISRDSVRVRNYMERYIYIYITTEEY